MYVVLRNAGLWSNGAFRGQNSVIWDIVNYDLKKKIPKGKKDQMGNSSFSI